MRLIGRIKKKVLFAHLQRKSDYTALIKYQKKSNLKYYPRL